MFVPKAGNHPRTAPRASVLVADRPHPARTRARCLRGTGAVLSQWLSVLGEGTRPRRIKRGAGLCCRRPPFETHAGHAPSPLQDAEGDPTGPPGSPSPPAHGDAVRPRARGSKRVGGEGWVCPAAPAGPPWGPWGLERLGQGEAPRSELCEWAGSCQRRRGNAVAGFPASGPGEIPGKTRQGSRPPQARGLSGTDACQARGKPGLSAVTIGGSASQGDGEQVLCPPEAFRPGSAATRGGGWEETDVNPGAGWTALKGPRRGARNPVLPRGLSDGERLPASLLSPPRAEGQLRTGPRPHLCPARPVVGFRGRWAVLPWRTWWGGGLCPHTPRGSQRIWRAWLLHGLGSGPCLGLGTGVAPGGLALRCGPSCPVLSSPTMELRAGAASCPPSPAPAPWPAWRLSEYSDVGP